MRHDIQFTPLASPGAPGAEEFLRIYAEALPPREQKPLDAIAALAGRADYQLTLAREEGRVMGFAIVYRSVRCPYSLLEYMAVDEAGRGRGLGAMLFVNALVRAQAGREEGPMLVEVESDREPAANLAQRRRRLQFYRRLGCRTIMGLPYHLPLPGEGPPPQMDLLACFGGAPQALRKEQLREWLADMYIHVYGCKADDARIPLMLGKVADPPLLE